MRRLIALEHLSLDGVIQAPGGPEEDTSGGFARGGWIAPYSDPQLGAALRTQMNKPFDLLLGRRTFEIWASYWPEHGEAWPGVNAATKYVASNTLASHRWKPSVFLGGDLAEKVGRLKEEAGPELHVWGSGQLLQTLLKHELVDAFWLMIYPLTLGRGKRLFAEGSIPGAFRLRESLVSSKGVIVAQYERDGALRTGSL